MKAIIQPSEIKGTICAPPSKSYAHRMLIGAALAEGVSSLAGISSSEDMLATLDCISALGAEYEKKGKDITIRGTGKKRRSVSEAGTGEDLPVFPCRESGSTLRFFIPVALVLCGGGVFTGTPRLIERGVGIYEELFREKDIAMEKTESSIRIKGKLTAGTYSLQGNVSSQFVTGMLYALALRKEDSVLEVLPPVESRAYIDITLDVLETFGIPVREERKNVFRISGGHSFRAGECRVEGDWSNAAFLYAFRAVGADLNIQMLKENTRQGDKACVSFFETLKEKDPESRKTPIDISDTPDLGPVLFAAAAALRGGSFTGTRRLRIKESDRVAAMAEELEKFGIRCKVGENELEVLPGKLKKPDVPLKGHNDHRIVMALSLLASLTGGVIEGAEAVRKSWPDYFAVMKEAGLAVEITE